MLSIGDFKKEVTDWADEIGVSPKEIHVRAMKRKWASCSSKGRVTLSSSLLEEPLESRAYVIVHELLHLKHPKHGKMFNSLLRAHLSKKKIKLSENL